MRPNVVPQDAPQGRTARPRRIEEGHQVPLAQMVRAPRARPAVKHDDGHSLAGTREGGRWFESSRVHDR